MFHSLCFLTIFSPFCRDTDIEQLNLDPNKVRRVLYGLAPGTSTFHSLFISWKNAFLVTKTLHIAIKSAHFSLFLPVSPRSPGAGAHRMRLLGLPPLLAPRPSSARPGFCRRGRGFREHSHAGGRCCSGCGGHRGGRGHRGLGACCAPERTGTLLHTKINKSIQRKIKQSNANLSLMSHSCTLFQLISHVLTLNLTVTLSLAITTLPYYHSLTHHALSPAHLSVSPCTPGRLRTRPAASWARSRAAWPRWSASVQPRPATARRRPASCTDSRRTWTRPRGTWAIITMCEPFFASCVLHIFDIL